ncbi:MAG: type IV secretion protein IcmC [Gammaproteobacteria bacterium]|nr:type IV secretion protein IcmC [Gammaproteobacteria bacterium]
MDFSAFSTWSAQNANILNNLANNLGPVQTLLRAVCYILGLAFAFKALYSLKAYGEGKTMTSTTTNMKEPLTYLFVSAVLLFLPSALGIMINSTFGSSSILAYSSSSSNNPAMSALFGGSKAGRAISTIIQTIGYIAFIRGWMMVAKSASQGGQQAGSTGKGLMHVFGGILAINIVSTMEIVNNTLYGTS